MSEVTVNKIVFEEETDSVTVYLSDGNTLGGLISVESSADILLGCTFSVKGYLRE